jgi:hypothetical protein
MVGVQSCKIVTEWSTEFELVNYTVADGPLSKSPVGLMDTVTVTIALRRYPSYYAITFVMPTLVITSLALFGSGVFTVHARTQSMRRHVHSGNESP